MARGDRHTLELKKMESGPARMDEDWWHLVYDENARAVFVEHTSHHLTRSIQQNPARYELNEFLASKRTGVDELKAALRSVFQGTKTTS